MTDPASEIPEDRDELERQIEQTRAELADTVEALAHKADVKARAQDRLTELREDPRTARFGAAGAAVLVAVGLLVWLVRRRRS